MNIKQRRILKKSIFSLTHLLDGLNLSVKLCGFWFCFAPNEGKRKEEKGAQWQTAGARLCLHT